MPNDNEQLPFSHGFMPTIGREGITFSVRSPYVRKWWSWGWDEEEEGPSLDFVSTSAICGVAELDKSLDDGIQVIGLEESRTRKLRFTLMPFETWDAVSRDFARDRYLLAPKPVVDVSSREMERLNNSYTTFDAVPPTARIEYSSYSDENGWGKWHIYCQAPVYCVEDAIKQIAQGSVEVLRASLRLRTALCKKVSEWEPTSWGLHGGWTGGLALGWLDEISWDWKRAGDDQPR